MTTLLPTLWRQLHGSLQWRLLWLFHHKFMVGVCGVVYDNEGRILLLQHRFWQKGSWGLPSGYLERGESLQDGIRREVKEETGLDISVQRLLRSEEHTSELQSQR